MTKTEMLYQHGTLAALVPGLFAGTLTVGDLMQHGDTGIGTLEGLDGELIILDGQVYQVADDGQVRLVEADAAVPFANVHYADFEVVGKVKDKDYEATKRQIIAALPTENAFAAIKLQGRFKSVQTRVVRKQEPPYPKLTETAANQQLFSATEVVGTVSGYFSPQLFAGMAAPGLHLHFLDVGHEFGGHLLDLSIGEATLAIQSFSDVQLHLPTANEAFRTAHFDISATVGDIIEAEG